MINNAIKQRALNFEFLYTVQDGLHELRQILETQQKISVEFKNKWYNMMGPAHRFFEGHPLLNWLYEIEKVIVREVR